jgi:hypothetical protein
MVSVKELIKIKAILLYSDSYDYTLKLFFLITIENITRIAFTFNYIYIDLHIIYNSI